MKQEISIVRGTTNVFGLLLVDSESHIVVLEEGQAVVFGVKKRPNDPECIFTKQLTHPVGDSGLYMELTPEDTADLPPGKYFYDVGFQQGNSTFYNIIEASPFEIKPNITGLGDGDV